jgi:rubrerythrin
MNTPLKGSETEKNLKEAFASESQAKCRYLYYARKADIEGYTEVARMFREVAEGETGHAFGHFEHLEAGGDETRRNLKVAIEGETYESTQMYPDFAKVARAEGFEKIAAWFETLARAEKSHASRFATSLDSIGS